MNTCTLQLGLVLISIITFDSCSYKLDIEIEDGEFHEQFEFEITDKELAPFDTSQETTEDSQDFLLGPSVSGYLGNARRKRSLPNEEICVQNINEGEHSSKIVVVEKGETFHLPCHACTDTPGAKFEPLQWIKLSPFPNAKSLYHIKEVLSDLHDDDRRNRILIKLDHTLVVKKAKRKDTGSYMCIGNVRQILNEHIPWLNLQKWMTENVRLNFFFHVDVLDMKHTKVLDVSEDADVEPRMPEFIPHLNLVVSTNWHSWSHCTVCGMQGLRKRVGICTVKKLGNKFKVPNGYLEHIFKFTINGLPCQSELLKQFSDEKVMQRPNEVQIEECLVPCETSTAHRKRRAVSKSELLSGEKEKGDKSKEVKVREGDSLIMVCPGSSITSLAVWMNGTENIPLMQLKKKTNKRISYDPLGNLIFSPVTLEDAGVYSCWLKEKMKRRFEVKVTIANTRETVHYSSYLGYVFLADFGVFVILSVIKFMNRRVQIRRRKTAEKKPVEEEVSSSDEETSLINDIDKNERSSSS